MSRLTARTAALLLGGDEGDFHHSTFVREINN